MKHLFVPIELMNKLEEKGFNEDCICGYNRGGRLVSKIAIRSGEDASCVWGKYDDSELRAATWMQIIDWFREVHLLIISVQDCAGFLNYHAFVYMISIVHTNKIICQSNTPWKMDASDYIPYKTYDDTLIKAIEEAIKII